MDTEQSAGGIADVEPAGPTSKLSTDQPDYREREPGDGRPDRASESAEEVHRTARRVLKLVLTLRPTDATGYHALLAVGSDDCDPLVHSVDVADLPSALNQAASLVAEAEVRWQTSPRNPTSVGKSNGLATRRSGPKQPTPEVEPRDTRAQAPDSEQTQAGQLKLFG